MTAGRPKIYDKKRTTISIAVDNEQLRWFDETAEKKGLTRPELLSTILSGIDTEQALIIAQELSNLRKQVAALQKENRDLFAKFSLEIQKKEKEIITGPRCKRCGSTNERKLVDNLCFDCIKDKK